MRGAFSPADGLNRNCFHGDGEISLQGIPVAGPILRDQRASEMDKLQGGTDASAWEAEWGAKRAFWQWGEGAACGLSTEGLGLRNLVMEEEGEGRPGHGLSGDGGPTLQGLMCSLETLAAEAQALRMELQAAVMLF